MSDHVVSNEAADSNPTIDFSKKIENIVISKPTNGYSAECVNENVVVGDDKSKDAI